jgi:hypothetical protein
MFRCERCGTGFNPTVAASLACCPRCRARDGVMATVSFTLFEPPGRMPAGGTLHEDEAPTPGLDLPDVAAAHPRTAGVQTP